MQEFTSNEDKLKRKKVQNPPVCKFLLLNLKGKGEVFKKSLDFFCMIKGKILFLNAGNV